MSKKNSKKNQGDEQIPQHVQVPTNQELTPDEKVVYTFLKKYMNKDTLEAFPSIATLSKDSGFGDKKVRALLRSIEEKGFLTSTERQGQTTLYKFAPYKKFEPYSMEFLDNPELTPDNKKFLICVQEHMFINPETHDGKISYSDRELSRQTSLTRSFISKNNKQLETLGFMTPITLKTHNSETGLSEQAKYYHLDKYGQQVACILQNHEDRLEQHDKDIDFLRREIDELKKQLKYAQAKAQAETITL